MAKKSIELAQRSWALVTGASSGLGISFATALAQRQHNLVLVARRELPMLELAKRLEKDHSIKVIVHPLDLGNAESTAALQQRLDADAIEVDILVANAAFAVSGPFIDQEPERIDAMLRLNVLSLTQLAHAFGRRMAQRRKGHILLVASVGAYTPSPLAASYSAAKSYVLSLGVALNVELAPDVGVTVVSPGLMETEFHDVAGWTMKASMRRSVLTTEKVAAIGLEAMFARRSSVVAGRLNGLGAFTSRLLPRSMLARMAYNVSKS
jgi:short-subunit dehydrogenase